MLLCYLSNRHAVLDLNLDKVQHFINLSNLYFLISLYIIQIQLNRQQFIVTVIVLAIITYFFASLDSYNCGWKAYISCSFFLFCVEMVVIICFILTVAIKDLLLKQNNKKLVIWKKVVQFKLTSQKKLTSIQAFTIPSYF